MSTSNCILILDDSMDRLKRFRTEVNRWPFDGVLMTWRSAVEFIAEIESSLDGATLISLDHDLYADDDSDPGDGLDVARHLAALAPCCSVLVHSSNVDRSLQMVGVLENAGWDARRVGAIGQDWIERDWSIEAKKIVLGHRD